MLIDSLENKKKIVNNLIEISEFEGWSDHSLRLAFNKSQIDEKYLDIIFENKIFSAIEFINELRLQNLIELCKSSSEFNSKKISEKISFALFNFLDFDKKNKISFKRLINFYVNPQNLIFYKNFGLRPTKMAFSQSYRIADFIWNLCGDQSTDFNFFSKRFILSKIIIRSFIYFVNDSSSNSQATKNFIEQQIFKVLKFNKYKNISKQKLNFLKNKLDEILLEQNNYPKKISNLLNEIPFIRLIKKNHFK